jgi:hypothetical protein
MATTMVLVVVVVSAVAIPYFYLEFSFIVSSSYVSTLPNIVGEYS